MTPSKGPWPFPTRDRHPANIEGASPAPVTPTEEAIDHGVEESFPASDPVSVTVTVVHAEHEKDPQASARTERAEPEDRFRQDDLHRPGQQGPVSAASGGTRSRTGSNYGDWHPDDPPALRGYDGSARSGDWVKGDKDAANAREAEQELAAPTSPPIHKTEKGRPGP